MITLLIVISISVGTSTSTSICICIIISVMIRIICSVLLRYFIFVYFQDDDHNKTNKTLVEK